MNCCKEKIFAIFLWVSFCIICVFSRGVLAGSEDRRFEEARIFLAKDVENLLISLGKCVNVSDCQKKQILFVSPKSGGVSVQLWGMRDARVIKYVTEKCSSMFLSISGMEEISIDIYSIEKNESLSLPFWKPVKSVISVAFRRNM